MYLNISLYSYLYILFLYCSFYIVLFILFLFIIDYVHGVTYGCLKYDIPCLKCDIPCLKCDIPNAFILNYLLFAAALIYSLNLLIHFLLLQKSRID